MAAGGGLGQRLFPWLGLAAVVILADQFTKLVVVQALAPGDSRVLNGWLNLVLAFNRGAAFSMFNDAGGWQSRVFLAIGIGASAFIVHLLSRHASQRLFCAALALILGGALGNAIDRALHGRVVDFLDVHARWMEPLFSGGHFPTFNVADSAITTGAVLLVLDELLRVRRAG